jgi:hypothetical protein
MPNPCGHLLIELGARRNRILGAIGGRWEGAAARDAYQRSNGIAGQPRFVRRQAAMRIGNRPIAAG